MRTSQTRRQALKAVLDPQKRLASLLIALSAAASILGLPPQFAAAQNAGAQPRIVLPIDENSRVTLRGNTHPLARAQSDIGVAADSQPLRRMLLLLQRGPKQEAALRKLLDDQQNASSPSFHRWLTPQQFGQQFGAADADLEAVTRWLESHGFEVNRVSAAKTLIEFSGNAGQVREAFQTEIHRYLAGGEEHLANAGDPQIPTALANVVAGPVSLNNFPRPSASHVAGAFQKNKDTGEVTPLPSFTFSVTGCTTPCNALGPGDFAAIYNVEKLWGPASGASIDGAGQTIAIVGGSEICTTNSPDIATHCYDVDDVASFRSIFGLPAISPNVIVDGPDPGFVSGDETEGVIDVEWAGAVAKNATIDYVLAGSTDTTQGPDLAAEYIVDNNLAPVLSDSFLACEAYLGNAGNQFFADLWEQAAAQGTTVVVAAGDGGSAGCDDFGTSAPNAAQYGASVNGIASTPFGVAVGGTDFDISATNYQSTYWNGGNSTVGGIAGVSATRYIPETTWNNSCQQNLLGTTSGCSPPPNSDSVVISAGGGGQSNCSVLNSGDTACAGFYAKPPWQTVAAGSGFTAANDLSRDTPDVSFFSAVASNSNSFYIICEADLVPERCAVSSATSFAFYGIGGTSVAAPAFAGIMALVNQNMAANYPALPAGQGNAGYVLYHLAANQSGLSCGSQAGPNPGCTFNDVTLGSNSVPCVGGSPNCSDTSSDGLYGVLETLNSSGQPSGTAAFNAGAGFDLAAGLGSVNAFNLVNNWPKAVGAFTPTTTTLCLSTTPTTLAACVPGPISIAYGQTVYVYASVTPSGGTTPIPVTWSTSTPEDLALIGTFSEGDSASAVPFTSSNYVVANTDVFQLSAGTIPGAATANMIGGPYTVMARYAGDGTYGGSMSSPGVSITVTSVTTTANVEVYPSLYGCCNDPTPQPYGSLATVRVDVCGPSVATCLPARTDGQMNPPSGTVTLTNNGGPVVDANGNPISTLTLTPQGNVEYQTGFLPLGANNFTVTYNGDATYKSSSGSMAVPYTIHPGPTYVYVLPDVSYVTPGSNASLTATVVPLGNDSYGDPITGTVTFFSQPLNCTQSCVQTPLGTKNLVPMAQQDGSVGAQTDSSLAVTPPASESISATFNPAGANPNYAGSTGSSVADIEVGYPSITIQPPAVNPINLTGKGYFFSESIFVDESYFPGNAVIAMTCSVTPTNLSDPPTCSMGSASITVSPQNPSNSSFLTVYTTVATSLVQPAPRPRMPDWFLPNEIAAIICGLSLLSMVARRRRRSMAAFVMLLAIVVAAGAGACGGGNSSPSAAPAPNPGTATGAYTVTVTATPPTGAAQQVAITVNVP